MRPTSTAAISLAVVLTLAAGCARTVVEDPMPTDYAPDDITAQLDFWHELPGRSAVSNDEGLHGVLLLFDGVDPTQDYNDRLALLKEREWLPQNFDEEPDLAMQRGTLAYVLCRAMDYDEGGVMYAITNGNRRYSTRELTLAGVMPEGSQLMVLDGLDYLGVVSRAQDYMVVRGLKASKRDIRQAAEIEAQEREAENQPVQDEIRPPRTRRNR